MLPPLFLLFSFTVLTIAHSACSGWEAQGRCKQRTASPLPPPPFPTIACPARTLKQETLCCSCWLWPGPCLFPFCQFRARLLLSAFRPYTNQTKQPSPTPLLLPSRDAAPAQLPPSSGSLETCAPLNRKASLATSKTQNQKAFVFSFRHSSKPRFAFLFLNVSFLPATLDTNLILSLSHLPSSSSCFPCLPTRPSPPCDLRPYNVPS